MVEVFREVWRVLREDGTVWVNLGDSYAASGVKGSGGIGKGTIAGGKGQATNKGSFYGNANALARNPADYGLKPKDLVGIPWRVAFALQADGWYLRSDIIWAKPNPMPESIRDRPTKAHEYLFLATKQPKYYYDAGAIAEPAIHAGETRVTTAKSFAGQATGLGVKPSGNAKPGSIVTIKATRNRRTVWWADVWDIATKPYKGAHFATFPPALVEPCVLAGAPPGSVVFDPFVGSGTVVEVAERLGRRGIGLELSTPYLSLAQQRCGRQEAA